MNSFLRISIFILILLTISIVNAQYEGPKSSFGIEVGGAYGDNAGNGESWSPRAKLDYQFKIFNPLFTQIGISYTTLEGGTGYDKTKTLAGDLRFLVRPIQFNQLYPFFYAGAGVAKNMQTSDSDFMPLIPVGLGIQTSLGEQLMFQLSAGYNLVLSDELDGVARTDSELNRFTNEKHDGFFEIMIGLFYSSSNPSSQESREPQKVTVSHEAIADSDGDGLTDEQEISKYKTDPKNPDTDGDGLSDGDEVLKYQTDPLKADTDSDGLSDGDEVMKYKTDPLKSDTDGDGLKDGEEIMKHKTDPLVADTDEDGLKDGDEVLKYMTDPLNSDTDGDGLSDYDEVTVHRTDPLKIDTDGDALSDYDEIMTYFTDPLKIDTDGGGMNDGAEIKANKNPLDPEDDLLDLTRGKKIVLHGLTFQTNKAEINPVSATILEKVRDSMIANPEVTVTIIGHTDNVGNDDYNLGLSRERAQAVKEWLIKNNISAARMKVMGKGETDPVATNETKEGRSVNRRIEFLVD